MNRCFQKHRDREALSWNLDRFCNAFVHKWHLQVQFLCLKIQRKCQGSRQTSLQRHLHTWRSFEQASRQSLSHHTHRFGRWFRNKAWISWSEEESQTLLPSWSFQESPFHIGLLSPMWNRSLSACRFGNLIKLEGSSLLRCTSPQLGYRQAQSG